MQLEISYVNKTDLQRKPVREVYLARLTCFKLISGLETHAWSTSTTEDHQQTRSLSHYPGGQTIPTVFIVWLVVLPSDFLPFCIDAQVAIRTPADAVRGRLVFLILTVIYSAAFQKYVTCIVTVAGMIDIENSWWQEVANV